MLSEEGIAALAERLRGLLDLELLGEDYVYTLIFVERERFQKDRSPTPVVVSNCDDKTTGIVIKLTARSL
jgi:hypothetical protein